MLGKGTPARSTFSVRFVPSLTVQSIGVLRIRGAASVESPAKMRAMPRRSMPLTVLKVPTMTALPSDSDCYPCQRDEDVLRHFLREPGVAEPAQRGRINQVHVSLDEALKGPFGASLQIFAQEFLVVHPSSLSITNCRCRRKTEMFFAGRVVSKNTRTQHRVRPQAWSNCKETSATFP